MSDSTLSITSSDICPQCHCYCKRVLHLNEYGVLLEESNCFYTALCVFPRCRSAGLATRARAVSGITYVWRVVKSRTAASTASRTWRTSAALEQRSGHTRLCCSVLLVLFIYNYSIYYYIELTFLYLSLYFNFSLSFSNFVTGLSHFYYFLNIYIFLSFNLYLYLYWLSCLFKF